MPYDANGNYSLPNGSLVATGQDIVPPQHNTPLNDISSALSQVVLRSGVAPMSGNLAMGGNRITNLAEPVGDNDAARKIDLPGSLNGSSVVYDETDFSIPTFTPLVIDEIDPDFREFIIEGYIDGLSTNPGITTLALAVGDGSTWAEFSASSASLARWANSNTSLRYFVARVTNLDNADLPIFMRSSPNSGDESIAFIGPPIYSTRPITALRFRLAPPSGSPVCNVSALRVTGIYK